MAEQVETRRNQDEIEEAIVDIGTVQKPEDVIELNYGNALASYSAEEQQEVVNLSQSIDVKKIDNIMHYGDSALKATFEQCGNFLKDESGSQADQEVISQVVKLAKKASSSYEDFTLALKEPNVFQKVILKISTGSKASQTEKIQKNAITNYKLLIELKNSCKSWLDLLSDAMIKITESAFSDVEAASLLEKYIIAGRIAETRIAKEMQEVQEKYQQTGLQKFAQEYDEMKEGYDIFILRLSNLEKSRVMYCLSLGQLGLIKRSNRNVQISITTQMNNSMALIGQQLRNAVLNAKTKEVLDGQKAISRLNDEIVRDLSNTVGVTAEQAEKLLYAGFYDVEAARVAITTVIDSCQAIQHTAEEMLPKMKADVTELNNLIKELQPHVDAMQFSLNDTSSIDGATLNVHKDLSF